ncbi:MAG: glycoside hydrolase family 3 protein [Bacteroidales bacterium]
MKRGLWPAIILILSLFVAFLFRSCTGPESTEEARKQEIERKVEALLSQMTLEEKIGQMTQVRHFDEFTDEDITLGRIGSIIHTDGPVPGEDAAGWQKKFSDFQKLALQSRLRIPLLFGVDAVHGQNTYDGATIFPHNIGLGASRNADLVQKAAAITALETQATGLNWTFSPCVAIPYNEKWGRVYEAFAESTELTQELTAASVKGHQGNLDDPATVLATAKHYVGDGATDHGIEGGETSLTAKEVHDRLLPPYRSAIQNGIGAVMVSFNTMAGISMHAHKPLITDTLKNSMGFHGIVLTDWRGYSRFGGNDVINAGIDMVMAVNGDMPGFQKGLKQGIDSGEVSMARVDDAVRRILRQKFRLGLFEHPFPEPELIKKIGSPEHRAVARQAVRESLVLLKNENRALPLDKDLEKIVVVGKHADNAGLQSGGWTIRWQGVDTTYAGATTILDGIRKFAGGEVVYDTSGTGNHYDAGAAIIVVGERPYAEFFGDIGDIRSSCSLTLTEEHQAHIRNYAGKVPAVIVVLISGRPLVVTEQIRQSDAFVAAWLPGSEGDGVAEVLFGDFDFSGKLPHTWPESASDFTGNYGPNFWDKTIGPLYEYGYGLNYSND